MLIWILVFVLLIGLALLWVLAIRPLIYIRKSGIDMTLGRFYQLQSFDFPTLKLLELASRFKKSGISLTWDDIDMFFSSARAELGANSGKFKKSPVDLFGDVLETLDLVKSEGYELSYQNAVMQVLNGKNPREITSDFVHLMWISEGKSKT